MKGVESAMEIQTIRQLCKALRMPTVGSQFAKLAEQAVKEKQSHLRYLEVLLAAEVEEREHRTVQRRLKEAHLRDLAQGNYIEQAEPVIFLGEAGTGKTHLATALCVAACQEKRRVRFTTAAGLVNELVSMVVTNWSRLTSSATCLWRMWERSCCFKWFRNAPNEPRSS